jgi:hypothetical protein
MDGDGQMESKYIYKLIAPILGGRADYTKGNRFRDFHSLKKMPKIRLLGNSFLSFLTKICSGYWSIMDPTNGFTAISQRALTKLNLNKISHDYFFESDMLLNLSLINAVVKDIDIPAKYDMEKSSLKITKVLCTFPIKLLKGTIKRIFYQYFIYDFNMASVYILIGLPMMLFGLIFGTWQWIDAIITQKGKPTGTIIFSVLPIVISVEMLLQAINIDINSTPGKK